MKAFSNEVRSEVISALLAGQGANEVARKYNISKASVSRLKNGLALEQLEQIETGKKDHLSRLIEGHLTCSLKAATELARKVSDDDAWFAKQNAADIGVLYGILTDKAVRILEAAESASSEGTADSSLVH